MCLNYLSVLIPLLAAVDNSQIKEELWKTRTVSEGSRRSRQDSQKLMIKVTL